MCAVVSLQLFLVLVRSLHPDLQGLRPATHNGDMFPMPLPQNLPDDAINSSAPVSPSSDAVAIAVAASPVSPLPVRLHGRAMAALALGTLLATAAALGVAPLPPDSASVVQRQLIETLASSLPAVVLPATPTNTDASVALNVFIREERVRRGDSLAVLLQRLGVNDPAAIRFLQSASISRMMSLKPERLVQVGLDINGNLQWLRFFQEGNDAADSNGSRTLSFLSVERSGETFKAQARSLATERRVLARSGTIQTTLYAATDDADIPDGVAHQMTNALDGVVDLHHDLKPGDRFKVVYEGFYYQGQLMRSGQVLGLEFVNGQQRHQLVWYADPGQTNGAGHYYTTNGQPLKAAFLQSPLEFTRISSGFSMRFHPLLHSWRAHRGVDYAAGTGTPVRSTADGTVSYVGQQSGYGNIVVVQHAGKYSTAYAHLSRTAAQLRPGSTVAQGQVIAYVGATGWATGPHLHYEFRVDGTAVDPLQVAMPTVHPLTGSRLAVFREHTDTIAHQLYVLGQTTVATLE